MARQYFRESRNQQERERDVGGEDFKVSLSESSMRENQKGEGYCRTGKWRSGGEGQ